MKPFISLLLLWLAHFLVDFMIGIWPVYKTMFHLDIATAGVIAGAGAFIGEGLQAVFGSLSDKGYRKKLIAAGLFCTGATALLAYTQSYPVLFLIFMTTCIGSGAFHPCAASLVGDLAPHRRGLLISIFASGGALGLAASQLIYVQAFKILHGSTIWLIIPSCLLVLVMVFYQFGGLGNARKHSHKSLNLGQFATFFKDVDLKNLYIAQVCSQSILWGLMFLLPDFLRSRGYEDWVCFGGGHLFFILGGAFAMIPSGFLADKYSCKSVLIFAYSFGILLFYCLLFSPHLETSLICTLLFGVGGLLGLVNPVSVAFANRLRPESSGAVSALMMGLVWCMAEGVGQAGGGLLTRLFDSDAPAKALSVLGSLLIVGLFFALPLPKQIPKTVQPEMI